MMEGSPCLATEFHIVGSNPSECSPVEYAIKANLRVCLMRLK